MSAVLHGMDAVGVFGAVALAVLVGITAAGQWSILSVLQPIWHAQR